MATATTGPETFDALLTWRPDVSIVDVRMPPTPEGRGPASRARRELPGLPVLILSQHVEQLYARELLASGPSTRRLDQLTEREHSVLRLMAEGLSNQAIGQRAVPQ